MNKISKVEGRDGSPDYVFHCPGCGNSHGVWTTQRNGLTHAIWSFNGMMDKPTFSPSLLVHNHVNGKDILCHSFITDGKIQYLNDCTHELAGKTIELEDVE